MVSSSEQISQESGEKKDVFRNHYKPWIEFSGNQLVPKIAGFCIRYK